MAKWSKNLKIAYSNFNENKEYSITEGIEILKKNSFEKFDPAVEVAFNLNLDTTKAEQQIRGSIVLPHGTGRNAKVLVIGETADLEIAKQAGADHTGGIEIMDKVTKNNWFDFDFIVTTPLFMPKLARFGKVLGPKGLMPNPKLGTVTTDVKTAVENIKKGQLEYRTDKEGIIALSIGKKSFPTTDLVENYNVIFNLIKDKKPNNLKGNYLNTITISSTMGPGIKIIKE
ncbi:MAG: 50S ribosomal protein L1 [Mycoplasmataceae bacterium]|nr:50S ribosomal protein L1 [Mycoplasmataceae bacterium]